MIESLQKSALSVVGRENIGNPNTHRNFIASLFSYGKWQRSFSPHRGPDYVYNWHYKAVFDDSLIFHIP